MDNFLQFKAPFKAFQYDLNNNPYFKYAVLFRVAVRLYGHTIKILNIGDMNSITTKKGREYMTFKFHYAHITQNKEGFTEDGKMTITSGHPELWKMIKERIVVPGTYVKIYVTESSTGLHGFSRIVLSTEEDYINSKYLSINRDTL